MIFIETAKAFEKLVRDGYAMCDDTNAPRHLERGHYWVEKTPGHEGFFNVLWRSGSGYYGLDVTELAGVRAYTRSFQYFGYIADKLEF